MEEEYLVDSDRLENFEAENFAGTGVFVRAKCPDGNYRQVDVTLLTKASLTSWLRSRNGANTWMENFIFCLLDHPY